MLCLLVGNLQGAESRPVTNGMNLLYFYDQDCDVCKEMDVVVGEYEEKTGESVLRIDIDESEEMKNLFKELATDNCEGVPFVFSQKTEKFICGLCVLEDLQNLCKS